MGAVPADYRNRHDRLVVVTAPKRLKLRDWLRIGLRQLAKIGPTGIQLENICAAAGKTRGSFYHHFRDHDRFCRTLVEYWRFENTDRIIAQVNKSDTAKAKRQALNRLAAALDPAVEIAMRNFAAVNAHAKTAVALVDRRRIDYLATLNRQEFGMAKADALELAEIEYAAFIGYLLLFPDSSEARFRKIGKRLDRMITGEGSRS